MKRMTRRRAMLSLASLAVLPGTLEGLPARADTDMSPTRSSDATKLQDLFDAAGNGETVNVPAGNYVLEGYIHLPQANDVTIEARDAEFSGGSARFYAAAHSGLTWRGGRFVGDGTKALCFGLMQVSQYSFVDMSFDQVHPFGWHLFDLIGCGGVVFDGLDVRGYGNTADFSEMPDEYVTYKEAIQIDYAYEGASGGAELNDLLVSAGGEFDGRATTDVKVINSSFSAVRNGEELISWAPCPMGQHSYSPDARNEAIAFNHNVVTDPIPLNSLPHAWPRGALHFVPIRGLEVIGNSFDATTEGERESWIQIASNADYRLPDGEGMLPTSDVLIKNNEFSGAAPTSSYVRLESDTDDPRFTISDVEVTGNTGALGDDDPTWVDQIGVATQFKNISATGNHNRPS